jgi:hypothetical protein
MKDHLARLKAALLDLEPTGDKGFEGLIAAVLSEIAGRPFRLASSGSQRGRDGDSAFDAGATYFEAKLYKNAVPKNEVLSKLTELEIDDAGQVDTWILASTRAVSAQHAALFRGAGARIGIGVLLLDWNAGGLPPLATALAIGAATAKPFFIANLTDPAKSAAASAALDEIRADPLFAANAEKLRAEIRDPVLSLGLAKTANQRWFTEVFSDRRRARQQFGQLLAPADTSHKAFDRPALVAKLTPAFSGKPARSVFAVLGDDGCGKSWLVAQCWSQGGPKPLMAMFTADELHDPVAMRDFEGVLIRKLINQTFGTVTESTVKRWQRRLAGWRKNPGPANVRLVVVIDGLNQAFDFPWTKLIDGAAATLEALGGVLIVTTRTSHYDTKIRGGLLSAVTVVTVPPWSVAELKDILKAHGIDPEKTAKKVLESLRNPRLLAIALELLSAKDIESFEELSDGRLLFEYMRRAELHGASVLAPSEFASALSQHAGEIIGRMNKKQHDDLLVFGGDVGDRLRSVSQSRFFDAVPGEPALYTLKDEGLPLALGLSIIGALRAELRNGRDPGARLATLLDPILALDRTGEVMLAAATAACLDDDCPVEIAAALLRSLADLQNLPENEFPAFCSLARARPEAFMRAARSAATAAAHVPNAAWLNGALINSRGDSAVWNTITVHLHDWLGTHSLSPRRQALRHASRDTAEEVAKEQTKLVTRLEERLTNLSDPERKLLDSLPRSDDESLDGLHTLAFTLKAGKSLAPFAASLRNWAFCNAVNTSHSAPDQTFAHLVRLNPVDWRAARDALLRKADFLSADGTSRSGQWALIAILRATGESSDAARAEAIAKELTKDRPYHPGWRLIEDYCESDPCDPASRKPGNIEDTAAKYRALDVAGLHTGMSPSTADHFFRDARPGLARFAPAAAIEVHRRFSVDIVGRTGFARRQGMLALVPHSAILEQGVVDALVKGAKAGDPLDVEKGGAERDEWITSQYALLAAFPHLDGNAQLATIAALPESALLIKLLDCTRPADAGVAERELERTYQGGDPKAQGRILSFIYSSRTELSPRSKQLAGFLLDSPDRMVRSYALAIAAKSQDTEMLQHVARSHWRAASLDPDKDYYELWYGSSALVAAAEKGLIGSEDLLGRIALGFYGLAAERLGAATAKLVAERIDAAIGKIAGLGGIPVLPSVEQSVGSADDRRPPLLSLADDPAPLDAKDFFKRLSESSEEYETRQKQSWQAFNEFSRTLTDADARIALEGLSSGGVKAMIAAAPHFANAWIALLANLKDGKLRYLHGFGVTLAQAVAPTNPPGAASLLRRLIETEPLIRYVVGPAEVPSETLAVWSATDVPDVKALCFARLDAATTDQEIAVEVLAAFAAGRNGLIAEYVDEKLATGEPAAIARALMVSGFSDTNPHADGVLKRYAGESGFLARTHAAAMYAYERNSWARAWLLRMKSAKSGEEFWESAMLLVKIVDGRYALWESVSSAEFDVYRHFMPTLNDRIDQRIKRWRTLRRDKLFGEKAPNALLLKSFAEAG